MKWRRKILAGIALAGIAVLVLGFAGVFSPGLKDKVADDDDFGETASDGTGRKKMEVFSEDFEAKGKNWLLRAPRARTDADQNAQLTDPELTIWRIRNDKDGDEKESKNKRDVLQVRATKGVYTRTPKQHVSMSGEVVVTFAGEQPAELHTDQLEADPVAQTGVTDRRVILVTQTKDGVQKITGTGADFVYKKRLVRVFKSISMELVGSQALMPVAEKEKLETTLRKTTVTCDGPCKVDGFVRTFVLENKVRIQQEGSTLSARRVEVRISDKERQLERFVAEGDVHFIAGEVKSWCNRLVRSGVEGQILLTGNPARVEQAGSRIEAAKIELDGQAGRIFVRRGGKLVLVQQAAKGKEAPEEMVVTWTRSMTFDQNEHSALFRGDVSLSQKDRRIRCQRLRVVFDKANNSLLECRAEEEVSIQGLSVAPGASDDTTTSKAPEKLSATCGEMVYRPQLEIIEFSRDAVVSYGSQVVRGERVVLNYNEESMGVQGPGSLRATQEEQDDKTEMRVSWKDGMRFGRQSGKGEFKGDVVLSQGNRKLSADAVDVVMGEGDRLKRLEARGNAAMEEKIARQAMSTSGKAELGTSSRKIAADTLVVEMDENNELDRLEGRGHVILTENTRQAAGEHVELLENRNTVRMRGPGEMHGIGQGDEEPVEVSVAWKGDMLFERKTGKSVFRKDVLLRHGERLMRSNELTAVISDENELRSLDATGGVTFEEKGRTAGGERLVWDLAKDQGILTGDPAVVRRGTDQLFGDTIHFAQQGGEVRLASSHRVEGRVTAAGNVGGIIP